MPMEQTPTEAYQACRDLASRHYENFPVASCFVPKALKNPICAIYAFARTADDLADEGNFSEKTRLKKLDFLATQLKTISEGGLLTDPIFIALKHTIELHTLPLNPFYDLLKAFKQDVVKNRYQTFSEVLNYCQYSANPVGLLLLTLAKANTPENIALSNQICTALQLINFFQDLRADLQDRNRCYLPLEELFEARLSVLDITTQQNPEKLHAFVLKQLLRVETIFKKGQSLGKKLPGLFGLEIRMIIHAANLVLQKLIKRHDPFTRPTFEKRHWPLVFWKAIYG